MDIADLYEDADFNDELLLLARKNLLPFDDYRQEVFLHLCEDVRGDPLKVADKIAKRMKRKQMREDAVSLDALGDAASDDDYASVLWEDRHVLQ